VRILRDHQYFFARSRNCATRDVFSHNLKSQSGHENLGRDFNSGAAHHFRGGLHRSGIDRRSAEHAKHELIGLVGVFGVGGVAMLSVDQFLRLISVPAVVAAFLIASQISGGLMSRSSPMAMASK
jgi:hypothetical protein